MSRVLCITLISLFSSLSWGFEQSLEADGVERISIDVMRGEVTINATETGEITVKGKVDAAAEEVIFERRGNKVVFKIEMPRNNQLRGSSPSNLTITVPHQAAVQFKSVSADVQLNGLNNAAQLETVSGDIAVDSMEGSLDISSVSGRIGIRSVSDSMRVNNVSGDIDIEADASAIMLNTVSGDVALNLPKAEKLSVTSVSGDVQAKLEDAQVVQIKMTSVNGEIDLTIGKDASAMIYMKTGPGGDIENRLTDAKPDSTFISEQSLKFQFNSGQGRIKMSTVSGDLIIR